MKNNPTLQSTLSGADEDVIRAYAYHLYEQSNYAEGHDLDNWLEASACLKANIPAHRSTARLHHHTETKLRKDTPVGL